MPTDDSASFSLGPPVDAFQIAGRLSVRQGERRDHLRFDWSHRKEADTILLTTPLGQGVAEVQRDQYGARLQLADGKRHEAADWQSLVQQVLGTSLPLGALPEWLRGAHANRQGVSEGWQIRVTDAVLVSEEGTTPSRQRRLPRVLEAQRDDIEVRVIVDDWGAGT